MLSHYQTDEQVDAALAELASYWEGLLAKYALSCADEKLGRMVNIWNQYQCMVTFNMSRSASYFESGTGRGMGFRDSCQDLLGFVHLIPDRARERLLDIAATQFEDGSAYHQYQPLTKKGNMDIGSGFNDDPLWLIAGCAAYIKETGDFSILDEQVDFDNDSTKAQPLMEHLKRSFDFTVTHLGPHKLPLIGRADWNDCLNLNCFSEHPGESFQTFGPSEGPVAESVFIAGMFVKYGEEYAQLCELMGDQKEAAYAREEVAKMYDAVLKDGWDGDWFVRAYDAYGQKIGSKECEEGQIYIESNGFCSLAGIGVKEGLAEKALNSVKEKLDTKYGVMILQPAYTEYHLELGEVSSYPPGYKENAGIFWSQLDSDTQKFADQIANGVGKISEVLEQQIADTTLLDAETLRSDFQELLTDMDNDSADFAGNFEEYMKNAILNSMIKEEYMQQLEDWRKKFYNAMDDGVTEDEYNALKEEGQRIADAMKARRDDMADMYGWAEDDTEREASQKGFDSMSQDSADELNGRFTTMVTHTYSINEGVKQIQSTTDKIVEKLVYLSNLDKNISEMTKYNNTIITHLSDISSNTARLETIEKTMSSIKTGIDTLNTKGITLKR